jgi:L-asparaginase
MLRNLTKPVILTGSQLPMEDSKSDGPRNLIHAVEIAAEARVHEVGVLFDSFLFRGNRCKKISIPSFRAFESPNFAPLAKLGVKIEYSDLHGPRGDYAFDPRIETRVLSIPLFPGIDVELLWSLTKNGVRGVVLQAFGPGDIPVSESSFVHWIRTLTERGIPTVICSQAVYGSVDLNLYETGRGARNVGAIGAGDMTWECSLVKMMILLGRGLPLAPFRAQFETSLAGELSK